MEGNQGDAQKSNRFKTLSSWQNAQTVARGSPCASSTKPATAKQPSQPQSPASSKGSPLRPSSRSSTPTSSQTNDLFTTSESSQGIKRKKQAQTFDEVIETKEKTKRQVSLLILRE